MVMVFDVEDGVCWDGEEERRDVLKFTVLMAATSQPSDCITKPAMVLPTYLLCPNQLPSSLINTPPCAMSSVVESVRVTQSRPLEKSRTNP